MIVGRAPAGHPVGNVAGLAVAVLQPPPVVDVDPALEALAQPLEAMQLAVGNGKIAGIRQDEDVEVLGGALGGELEAGVLEHGKDRLGILVIDRHQNRIAPERPAGRGARPASGEDPPEADQRAGAGKGDPGEGQGKHHREQELQPRCPAWRHHVVDLVGAEPGQQRREDEHEKPRADHLPAGAPALDRASGGPEGEILGRHVQRRFKRHEHRILRHSLCLVGRDPQHHVVHL